MQIGNLPRGPSSSTLVARQPELRPPHVSAVFGPAHCAEKWGAAKLIWDKNISHSELLNFTWPHEAVEPKTYQNGQHETHEARLREQGCMLDKTEEDQLQPIVRQRDAV